MRSRLVVAFAVTTALGCGAPYSVPKTGSPSPGGPAQNAAGSAASEAPADKGAPATASPAPAAAPSAAEAAEMKATFDKTLSRVKGMVDDPVLKDALAKKGLVPIDVEKEAQVGAKSGSADPGKTGFTFELQHETAGGMAKTLIPVIRTQDASSRKAKVAIADLMLRTGNHLGRELTTTPLKTLLEEARTFAARPGDLGISGSLIGKADKQLEVSAQAVFLPVPRGGKVEFTPVVYPSASAPESAAVLTIVVTRQGTSMQVLRCEGAPGEFRSSQKLFFNAGGRRTPLTAEWKADVAQRIAAQGGPRNEDERSAIGKAANVMFLIEVPLKAKAPPPPPPSPVTGGEKSGGGSGGRMSPTTATPASAPPMHMNEHADATKDTGENETGDAVLGHGAEQGAFAEGDGTEYVRDGRYPIRVVVQFYKVTTTPIETEADLDAANLARSVGSAYAHADVVGSLLVPANDPRRPAKWANVPADYFPW